MDQDVETFITDKCCHPCQVSSQQNQPTLIQSNKPREYIALDIVLIDYYSRWTEVEMLRTTTTKSARVLKWLDSVFATHGGPNTLQTDKGSYITSLSWIQKHPKSMGNRTAHCNWILAAGEWISGRFNEVPLKFIQTLLAKERSGMNSSQRCFETIALRHISPQERHQHYP